MELQYEDILIMKVNLKRIREFRGYSLEFVKDMTGINVKALENENYIFNPKSKDVENLIEFYGVNEREIIYRKESI